MGRAPHDEHALTRTFSILRGGCLLWVGSASWWLSDAAVRPRNFAVVGRHARTAAVAISDLLGRVGEGQVPRWTGRSRRKPPPAPLGRLLVLPIPIALPETCRSRPGPPVEPRGRSRAARR